MEEDIMVLGLTSGLLPLIILAGVVLIVLGLIRKIKSLIRIGLIVAGVAFLMNGGLTILMSAFQ